MDVLDIIPTYSVPKVLVFVLKNNLKAQSSPASEDEEFWITFLKELPHLNDISDCSDYITVFTHLLYLEECFSNDSLDDTTKKKAVKVQYTKDYDHYRIWLKNIEEEFCFLKPESIVELQNVKMVSVKKGQIDENVEKHLFLVTQVLRDSIIVKAVNYERFRRQHIPTDFYYIEFEYSNWPIRVCHFALEMVEDRKVLDSLQLYTKRLSSSSEAVVTSWFNKNVEKNPEQMQAVKRILGRTSYPSPYLVFGPPGTGKTATIVEAVCQLNRRRKNVLICTPSNAAADEITRRLLQCKISENLIYRMTSRSVDRQDIPEDVKVCINFEKGDIEYLHSSEIARKSIVISTLVSGARFLRLTSFRNHFDYIFVDEAGQATEPETIIPIAISSRHGYCQIVMSGDPKQLGPVVMTKHGEHLLGKSMLERLMEKSDLYKKDYDNKYDPNFITKLVQNYRSHEAILRLPNDMFYDSELVACAGNEAKIAENWKNLPRKTFPIIFHAVQGYEKSNGNHSVANIAEAKVVVNYVEKLLNEGQEESKPEDLKFSEKNIGIVTPFRNQKSVITDALREKEISEISVGTVESFQGQERDVIIVSLVRSVVFEHDGKYHVGFLSDEKRFNVTITRAKCLLIVIGHPKVLQIDDCWKKFIIYCKDNKACLGQRFPVRDITENELNSLVRSKNRRMPKGDKNRKEENREDSASKKCVKGDQNRKTENKNASTSKGHRRRNQKRITEEKEDFISEGIESLSLTRNKEDLLEDSLAESEAEVSPVVEEAAAAQPEELDAREPNFIDNCIHAFKTILQFP